MAAIGEQAGRLINCSNLYYTEPMVALAEWLRDRSLGGKVYFCNSGAEASEAALKLARKRGGPGRTEVVALDRGFHGRTLGALSLTGQPAKQDPFRPLVPGVHHVERNDRIGLEVAVSGRTCAIFWRWCRARRASTRWRTASCAWRATWPTAPAPRSSSTEAQTGLSRTGPLFAHQDT